MSKRRFFIIGKGSGSVMRHLTVNVGGGHGSLLVNGNVVTLNENNTYEGDFPDGTQIELETVASTGYNFEGWYDDSEDLWPGGWNYDNPTTFTLDGDYSLELHFVEMFNVVVQTSLDPSYGYITVNGEPGNFSDEAADGSELTLQGVPDNTTGDGRRVWFSYWYDGSSYDYSNPTTYTVNNDVTIEAGFSVDHFTEFIVDPTKYSIVRGGQTMTQTFTDAFISGSCKQYEVVCETGYQFDGWLVDGVLDQDTSNPRYFCDNGADRTVEPSVSAVTPTPPNDEIWYETSDNQTADFSNTNFNATISSNTYSNGKGVVKFDNNVTSTSDSYGSPSTATNLTKIWFPDSFTTVGNYSFMKCPLTYVSFNNITTIGYRAFDFNEITSLYIPPALSSIGDMGLRGKYLTNITVNPNNQTFSDGTNFNGSNCIYNPLYAKVVLGCVNTVIPDNCTEIGRWAFSSNKLLTTIDFKNVIDIDGWAADFDINELSGPALETIYVRSTTPATFENTDVFDNQKTNGILYYESGVDYQRWLDVLPSGWTAQLIS